MKIDTKLPKGIITDVPLAPMTTFGVGGSARFFVTPESREEVIESIEFARSNGLEVFVLGGGSNILVSDNGFDGLVMRISISDISYATHDKNVLIDVGAGVAWDDFVAEAVARDLIGIECLSGIPGTVGGAVVANLGAYGAQCSDILVRADILERSGSKYTSRVIDNEQCGFSYHDSVFGREKGRYVVLRATFSLAVDGNSRLSYRDNRFDLEALAKNIGHEPTPKEVREAILFMRSQKGMVPGMFKSAGSFFHMPFVTAEHYQQILSTAQKLDAKKEEQLRPWAWEQPDGSYKIAGGFLLEYTEFIKGYTRDGAGISPMHTLSIINTGGASARSISALASDMQDAVKKIFNVTLEREVEYVGEF